MDEEDVVPPHQPLPSHLPIPHRLPHLAELAHYKVSVSDMMGILRQATCRPVHTADYYELYTMYNYRKSAYKKLRSMKASVTEANVQKALADNRFWRQVLRVRHTYPDHGDRMYLYLLVGKRKHTARCY